MKATSPDRVGEFAGGSKCAIRAREYRLSKKRRYFFRVAVATTTRLL